MYDLHQFDAMATCSILFYSPSSILYISMLHHFRWWCCLLGRQRLYLGVLYLLFFSKWCFTLKRVGSNWGRRAFLSWFLLGLWLLGLSLCIVHWQVLSDLLRQRCLCSSRYLNFKFPNFFLIPWQIARTHCLRRYFCWGPTLEVWNLKRGTHWMPQDLGCWFY